MIAFAENKQYTPEQVHAKFLELMPLIVKIATLAFRDYDADRKDDAIQSVLVQSYISVKRLADKGRLDEAYASPIARFAVRSHKTGRPGGVPMNSTDVLAERCRCRGRSRINNQGLATEIYDPFETDSAFKIDFEDWYRNQSARDQEIIREMFMGSTTNELAEKFGVSAGAISQRRRKYETSWKNYMNPVRPED